MHFDAAQVTRAYDIIFGRINFKKIERKRAQVLFGAEKKPILWGKQKKSSEEG